MRPLYLVDTCIWSEAGKSRPNAQVLNCLERYQELLAISAVCWHELVYGIERLPPGKRKEDLHRYLMEVLAPNIPVIPYDESVAWVHARIRIRLEAAGSTIPFVDSLIAATAIANNMILVTRNTGDFTAINELMIENWFEGSPGSPVE